jgi:anaerobic selenocysteine-containing dehydrogenase
VQVQLGGEDGRQIVRTKGDEAHPSSQGYLCNKASRLNYYQNRRDRLLSPMRRREDGTYETVDWDTAIREIADKLTTVRDTYGGEKIFYYGGGGQGNHVPGVYSRTSLGPLGMKYRSNALAQEKTGEFWVANRMFGGWAHGDFEHCQVALFIGKNPWHSHGISRARATLREIARDPNRTLIVIDPKRTETADLADVHLAVKPARDAWLLAAMAAVIVQEDLVDHDFVANHVTGFEDVFDALGEVSVAQFAELAGIAEDQVRDIARLIAGAESVAVFEDLGVQMNRHSTLVSFLQRLLWIPTGHFGREGTNYLPNSFGGFGGGAVSGESPVTGSMLVGDLVPCNVIAEEILTDHPQRFRAMVVESSNPAHSLADSERFREAMRALECTVVIDVAMTETAREADYVLPTSTQYEKAEATFFNFEFPENYFHIRHPLMEPPPGVLCEAEIHTRLAEAMGVIPQDVVSALNAALDQGRDAFREAVFAGLAENPSLAAVAPGVLYRTLGHRLPKGMEQAAGFWALAHQYAANNAGSLHRAGIEGESAELGEALFDALISSPSGMVFSQESWDDVWSRVSGPLGRISLDNPELTADLRALSTEAPKETSDDFPFVLSAGERRAFTANTIFRDPDWRRKDKDGALFIHPEDAARLNLGEGAPARITTRRGAMNVVVELTDRMQRGHISLPNGLGLDYPDDEGSMVMTGTAPNELTSAEDRDPYVGTPWHKSVPAALEAI